MREHSLLVALNHISVLGLGNVSLLRNMDRQQLPYRNPQHSNSGIVCRQLPNLQLARSRECRPCLGAVRIQNLKRRLHPVTEDQGVRFHQLKVSYLDPFVPFGLPKGLLSRLFDLLLRQHNGQL